jgi:hypothetical protein
MRSISTKYITLAFYNLLSWASRAAEFRQRKCRDHGQDVDGEESKIGELLLRWTGEVFPYFTFFPTIVKDLTDDASPFV